MTHWTKPFPSFHSGVCWGSDRCGHTASQRSDKSQNWLCWPLNSFLAAFICRSKEGGCVGVREGDRKGCAWSGAEANRRANRSHQCLLECCAEVSKMGLKSEWIASFPGEGWGEGRGELWKWKGVTRSKVLAWRNSQCISLWMHCVVNATKSKQTTGIDSMYNHFPIHCMFL